MTTKITKVLIDRIFKQPGIKYELAEFETLGKPIHDILSIYPKTVEKGRDAGKTKYYLKTLVPFSSGKEETQVYVEGGKSAPEEIVRQLWVYKLIHQYDYQPDEIDLEKSVQFGTEVGSKAAENWPGIFRDGEDIELTKRHLQVCVGPIKGVRLMGSNLRIMDDAFEYLLPTEAKKKKGQFFTPRHVIEMCVRMLNPKPSEYVMDPACGSGGFLLHAMDWCYPARNVDARELRKFKYASKYLWGIDFETRAAKTARALMLIAGDGHTNIFGPDVSSLDPKTWYESGSGQALMHGLRQSKLTAKKIPANETLRDDDHAWEYFQDLKFDVILTNPPFAGEMKDRKMLVHYELAKPALKRARDKAPKEERDVLFIERVLKMLKPGGRSGEWRPKAIPHKRT